MSDHRRVKGNPTDEETHYRARCFRVFVYELATKVEAIRLGLLNKNGLLAERSSSSSRHLVPAGSACIMCGKARISTEHKAICEHPLWPLLDATVRNATLHPDLHSLLADGAARDQLVPQDEQDPKVARLKRPGSSMQKAARSLAKEKSTAKQNLPCSHEKAQQKVTANIWNNLAKHLFDLIFLVECLMDATAPIVIRQSDLYKFRITKKF